MRSRDRLEEALARIADPAGEGAKACLTVYATAARAAADAADRRAQDGLTLGPLDGAIVTLKDLYDVAGEVTRAGSPLLAEHEAPAKADAVIAKRLRAAGAVIVAKTNMTEFAFSGVGANPHYGTPGNPFDRSRIPGGSTSGGAVAVADGMCEVAVGSDTGGSTRIPAALCDLVGYKATKSRISMEGALPLCFTLDSAGAMARTVRECADVDAVMAGHESHDLDPAELANLKFGIIQGLPLDRIDSTVANAFQAALSILSRAGIVLTDAAIGPLDDMMRVNGRGGIVWPECHAIYREKLKASASRVDPNVVSRIMGAAPMNAADYILNVRERVEAVARMDDVMADYDLLVMPTTAIVAPTMEEIATPQGFSRCNAALLRNTSIVNFFDLCAVSLPIRLGNSLPCGLSLVARNGQDERLFAIASAIEPLLNG